MVKDVHDRVAGCFEPPPEPGEELGPEWFVTWRNRYWNSTKHAVLAPGQWGGEAPSLCGRVGLHFFQGLAYGDRRCRTCERLAGKLGVRVVG